MTPSKTQLASHDQPLNVVVVEDHAALRELLIVTLEAQGCKVKAVPCAEDVNEHSGSDAVDVFIIDLNLPGEDGLSLTRRLRKIYPLVGLILLTARTEMESLVAGYENGADVYLVKPIADQELLSTVHAVARKKRTHEKMLYAIRSDELVLDRATQVLSGADGQSVNLTEVEAIILSSLAKALDFRLENWQLLEATDGPNANPQKSNLAVRLTRLRKKMQSIGIHGDCLENIRNEGYKLTIPLKVI